MDTLEHLIEESLRLSPKDRAMLTCRLLQSLDPPGAELTEEDWQCVWDPELERRLNSHERGKQTATSWQESIARSRASLEEDKTS